MTERVNFQEIKINNDIKKTKIKLNALDKKLNFFTKKRKAKKNKKKETEKKRVSMNQARRFTHDHRRNKTLKNNTSYIIIKACLNIFTTRFNKEKLHNK